MHISKLLIKIIIFLFIFTKISIAQNINIGGISIARQEEELKISNGDKSCLFNFSDPQQQIYIMQTPFVQLQGYDGGIDLNQSTGITELEISELNNLKFPKFKFLDDEEKYIGLIVNKWGASGGSLQQWLILDTLDNNFFVIDSEDMVSPEWLINEGKINGYIKNTTNLYMGSHSLSLGYSNRISDCFLFKNNDIVSDPSICIEISDRKYKNIIFSENELNFLKSHDLYDVPQDLGIKLLDMIYYGIKLGKKAEIDVLVSSLNYDLKDEVKSILDEIDPF